MSAITMLLTLPVALPVALAAQMTIPAISYDTSSLPARPVSAIEAAFDVVAAARHARLQVPPNAETVAFDSLDRAVLFRARAWLSKIRSAPIAPYELDAAARVAFVAGEDTLGHQWVAKRLAAPGLSPVEQGRIAWQTVQVLVEDRRPARVAAAELYTTRLDRLPVATAGLYAYQAHSALASAYDRMGDLRHAAEHAERALAIIPQLVYLDRIRAYGELDSYGVLANAWAETPAASARLDTMAAQLLRATTPPADLVARDPSLLAIGHDAADAVQSIKTVMGLLGRAAPSIQATTWWNDPRSAGASTTLSLADGTPRLILFGTLDCCYADLVALQRLQARLPKGTQSLYVTATRGVWGMATFVSAAEEMERLGAEYRQRGITVPIALWAGTKQATTAGGMLPSPSPNVSAFHVPISWGGAQWVPFTVITDGKGIVRRILYDIPTAAQRDYEQGALALLAALVRGL